MMDFTGKNLPYDELERLILAFQDGDTVAGEKIINAFGSFFLKFYKLLIQGQVIIENKSIRNFLTLFIKSKEIRTRIHTYKRAPSARYEMYKMSNIIKDQCNYYDPKDIEQELVLTLLIMAKRYQSVDGNPRFHTYVMRTYHFYLFRQLQPYLANIINDNLQEGDALTGTEGYTDLEQLADNKVLVSNGWDDEININWINGITCSEQFTKLTTVERQILKWYYIDKLTDTEIGHRLGYRRETINKRRNTIKDSIKL